MARFEIEFSKSAAKDYKKLPKEYKLIIDLVLSTLPNGFPADISASDMLFSLATLYIEKA